MYIGSGLNTVSSLYGQQKGNQMKTPASGEKTFCTVETPKVYQIFITDTNREHLDRILHKVGSDYKMFQVDQGVITEREEDEA